MKTKTLFLLPAVMLLFSVSSCKKGANDPAFPFSSRDARITADWVLNSLNQTTVHTETVGDNTYTSTTTYVFDGTTMKKSSENGFGTQEESYPYSYEIIINEDGTYNETVNEDGEKTEKTDYWFWANSDKSKIAITFDGIGTFMIDRLAKDELVLFRSIVSSNTDTDGNTTVDKTDITMIFSKK